MERLNKDMIKNIIEYLPLVYESPTGYTKVGKKGKKEPEMGKTSIVSLSLLDKEWKSSVMSVKFLDRFGIDDDDFKGVTIETLKNVNKRKTLTYFIRVRRDSFVYKEWNRYARNIIIDDVDTDNWKKYERALAYLEKREEKKPPVSFWDEDTDQVEGDGL